MSDVSSVTTTSTVLETWLQEAQAYCEANGIDIDEINYVDDPQLLAYYQNALLQLYEIVYQTLMISGYSAVGEDGSSEMPYTLGEYQAFFTDDIEKLVEDMLQSNPELVAYFAYQSGGQSEIDAFLNYISAAAGGATGDINNATADAQSLQDQCGLGDWFDTVIDEENAHNATMVSYMQMLSEIDQGLSDLASSLASGDMTEGELMSIQGQMDGLSGYRDFILALMPMEQSSYNTIMQLWSNLVKSNMDTQLMLEQNQKLA
jgi:hypothetical protein